MKRTIVGHDAFHRMLTAELPEKTATYTPIFHTQVISRVRKEIGSAGFIITAEDYRCTNNGQVGIGNYRVNYKSDPDIELTATFINSYNKQVAFRFTLGAMVRVCLNGMFISDSKFGMFRRVHTGAADMLSENMISNYLKGADAFWGRLVDTKDQLKGIHLGKDDQYSLLGHLFFEKKVLNTLQMNLVRDELAKPSFDYHVDPNSAWALYNHITLALKESHPSEWMDHHVAMNDVFIDALGIRLAEPADPEFVAPLVLSEADMLPTLFDEAL